MTYDEWEKGQRLNPVSPEASAAEAAWNAALQSVRNAIRAAAATEATVGGLVAMLEEELSALETPFGEDFR